MTCELLDFHIIPLICIYYLIKLCVGLQDLGPIEKLWKNTKRDATHLKYFKTFEDLHDSVVKTFKSYMLDASKVICVMQKMREDFAIVG